MLPPVSIACYIGDQSRGAATPKLLHIQPAKPSVMSIILEGSIPPPHLLQARSASSWPSPPYYPHDYPASASSPIPMSPRSLHSYMNRPPGSILPTQELHNLSTSGWCGPSIPASEYQSDVCTFTLVARSATNIQLFRPAMLHTASSCLHKRLPSTCHHPYLRFHTQRKLQCLLRKPIHQVPSLQVPSTRETQWYPSRHAHQWSPSPTQEEHFTSQRLEYGNSLTP
jgi:hypothetical protein